MIYTEVIIFKTKKEIVPKGINNNLKPITNVLTRNLRDIFNTCEDLKDKNYLDVTESTKGANSLLSYKGKKDLTVYFDFSYMFLPYTKKLYVIYSFNFNNLDLVNDIFKDNVFSGSEHIKAITDYISVKINNECDLEEDIEIDSNRCDSKSFVSNNNNNCHLSSDFELKEYIGDTRIGMAVIKQDIIVDLNNDLTDYYNSLKSNKNLDYNDLLLSIKRRYIDYLNIENEYSIWSGKKDHKSDEIDAALEIDEFNKMYLNKLEFFEDLVKTIVDKKNIALGDMLNTIQISSIILTIVGWVLVILQHDLPSRVAIYIVAILLCSFVSIFVALLIKKIINRK